MSPPEPNATILEPAPMAGAPWSSAAAPAREVKISITDLDFYYGSHHALKSISVDIFAREVTALIGPSGCGKSTFLRCLNRMNELLPATRSTGVIALDGQSIYERSVDVVELRKQVGMVFQKPNPFPMSIWENIAAGPRIHGTKKRDDLDAIVEQSLRRAALWDEVKDDLRKGGLNLSGGQQQRLCIARALAINPQVILMDEPCSALDPISTYKIEELIEELREQYTIIIVTHNMHQASRISQRTGFFLLGDLIEVGPTGQLFEAPADQRTDDYIRGRMG